MDSKSPAFRPKELEITEAESPTQSETCQVEAVEEEKQHSEYSKSFKKFWGEATSDNRLTLFGFRRYRTTHLLNLRFLEEEIGKLDRTLYQIGLREGEEPVLDRLGLKHAKRDATHGKLEDINEALILRLRKLIKEYDEALVAFNHVLTLETFNMIDNPGSLLNNTADLHAYEQFKTRLVRIDLPPRLTSRDPIQHYLRKGLRRLWFWFRFSAPSRFLRTRTQQKADEETLKRTHTSSALAATWERNFQNTARVAETGTRFLVALLAGGALVGPMVILTYQEGLQKRVVTIAICIVLFCFIMTLLTKGENSEVMAASAAYAAVLSVFVSNTS